MDDVNQINKKKSVFRRIRDFCRNIPLVRQFGHIFAIFIFILSLGNMTLVYRTNLNMLLRERSEPFAKVGRFVVSEMEKTDDIDWLFYYWQNNYDKMDIIYDDENEVVLKHELFHSKYPEFDVNIMQLSDVLQLDREGQKLYAELKYMEWLVRFNKIKDSYGMMFFSALVPFDYDTTIFILSASSPGQKRGTGSSDAYLLGTVIEEHSNSDRYDCFKSGKSFDRLNIRNVKFAHIYIPLLSKKTGKTIAVIDVVIETGSLKEELFKNIVGIEFWLLIGLIIGGFILFLLIRVIVLRPLKVLQNSMIQFRTVKDPKTVLKNLEKYISKNEIGSITKDFTMLVSDVDNYTNKIASLASEKERIDTELLIATTIQSSILPQKFPAFPERNEFDIFASMNPAKEVGGDFYDFFMIDDDHIALVIADVSGKGIPAALYMMVSRTVIQVQILAGNSVEKALTIINNTLSKNNAAEMFVSAWIGIYEISTGVMRCANAGHEYPVIKRVGGKFEVFKDTHGFVLGGMRGIKYKSYELKFNKGDVLFVYTDGIPEATNYYNELLGMDRMIDMLNIESEDDSPKGIIEKVKDGLEEYVQGADQADDITMLAFKINGDMKNMCVKELTLDATFDHLENVTNFVNEVLEEYDCPAKAEAQIDIAIDELFSNIARYAYNPDTGPATVRVEVLKEPLSVIITFIDAGVPFNPLERRDPDTHLPAEERDIGGLGIFMVKQTMDEIEYEYKDGKNILRIKKRMS